MKIYCPWRAGHVPLSFYDFNRRQNKHITAAKRRQIEEDYAPRTTRDTKESNPSDDDVNLSDYLLFGRFLGEQPKDVQQQLQLNGINAVQDQQSADYLQQWENEESENYDILRSAVAGRDLQVHVSNKLKRNKNRWTPTTMQDALEEFEKERKNGQFKLTSKQKTLARNKNRLTGLPPLPLPSSGSDEEEEEEEDVPSSSSTSSNSKPSSIRGLEKLAPKPQRKVVSSKQQRPSNDAASSSLRQQPPKKTIQFTSSSPHNNSSSNRKKRSIKAHALSPHHNHHHPYQQELDGDAASTSAASSPSTTITDTTNNSEQLLMPRPVYHPAPSPTDSFDFSSMAGSIDDDYDDNNTNNNTRHHLLQFNMVPPNNNPNKKKLHVNRLRSLKCAKIAIDTGSIEQFKVWKVNAAGVLVENRDISGFIPLSLLGEVHTARVLAEEKYLKQQEKEKKMIMGEGLQEGREEESDGTTTTTGSSSGSDDTSSGDDEKEETEEDRLLAKKKKNKSELRKKAMSVMMGRTVLGMVLDIDRVEGRVLISERAALKTWGKKPPPPKEELLNGASNMVGKDAVQGMVIKVKPFGCFVEFVVATSTKASDNTISSGNGNGERRNGGGGRKEFLEKGTTLIGLVHASRLGCENGVCPTDFIGMGTKVEVYVERVDMKKRQVFLSMLKREKEEVVTVEDGGTTAVVAVETNE